MRLFRRLAEILSPPKASQTEAGYVIPFGLTPPEWEALKTLRERPEWPIFLQALDFVAILSAEQLLVAAKDESLHFHRGMALGLRKAGTLLDEALVDEKNWKHEQQQRTRIASDPAGRSVALFGSPGWRNPQRDASGR